MQDDIRQFPKRRLSNASNGRLDERTKSTEQVAAKHQRHVDGAESCVRRQADGLHQGMHV